MKLKGSSWVVGVTVLCIGTGLLVFTFVSAYTFLISRFTMGEFGSLSELFGSALAPLLEACIHAVYLGIMGWIGAILTSRGIRLMVEGPKGDESARKDETAKQP